MFGNEGKNVPYQVSIFLIEQVHDWVYSIRFLGIGETEVLFDPFEKDLYALVIYTKGNDQFPNLANMIFYPAEMQPDAALSIFDKYVEDNGGTDAPAGDPSLN